MRPQRGGRLSVRMLICVVAALVVVPLFETTPAGAVPSPPQLLYPANHDGENCSLPNPPACITSNPIFSWGAESGARNYRIQVSTSNSFANVEYEVDTYNTSATPPNDLSQGVLYWRVRTTDITGTTGSYSSTFQFTKSQPLGPTPVSPSDEGSCNPLPGGNCANQLVYPDDAPTLRWQPQAGAAYYRVEVANNVNFTAPLVQNPTDTPNTSFTLANPPAMNQLYYWHVQAFSADNKPTQFSPTWTFSMKWPQGQPTNLFPLDAATVQEVNLAWDAVPGATYYELQVSPNIDFTTFTISRNDIRGTRFTSPLALQQGAYYWRVRAITVTGTAGPWSDAPAPPHTFTRLWPYPDHHPANPVPSELERAVPLSPIGGATVATPTFKWSPVRLASFYLLETSTNDPNFSSPSSCTVRNTTYTPSSECGLNVVPGQITYWRVRPIDTPGLNGNVNSVYSPTASFIWNPGTVAQTAPANGATVSTPLLRWNRIAGIYRYKVEVLENGNTVSEQDTYNIAYAPPNVQAGHTYTWRVRPYSQGSLGAVTQATTRTFTLQAPGSTFASPSTVTPNGTSDYSLPALEWTPMTPPACNPQPCTPNPVTYRVYIGVLGQGYVQLADTPQTAYAYPDGNYLPGAASWYVQAFQDGQPILPSGTSNTGSVTINALSSGTLTGPASCTTPGCTTLWDTPTLTWSHTPGASVYNVSVATDVNFTNVIYTFSTQFDTLTPTFNFVDQQAGQALYWYVRPCKINTSTQCGPGADTYAPQWPAGPVRAFRKQSAPIAANAVNDPAFVHSANPVINTVTDQATFSWTDFLDTNQAIVPAVQAPPIPVPTQEAKVYRIQVSTTSDMSQIIDQIETDATQYTAYDRMYPDGPIYWRVQARDATDNFLTWSCSANQLPASNPTCPAGSQQPRLVTKASPIPSLISPAAGAAVSEVPTFRWAPVTFSRSYDIEVYKNVGDPLSDQNRVLGTSQERGVTAFSPVNSLPGPGTYGWRVRRRDAHNNPGPWSAIDNVGLRLFTYTGNSATLVSPAESAYVPYNKLVFQWQAASGAARYRINVSTNPPNAQNIVSQPFVEQQQTLMTAWAPQNRYNDGVYYWQVETVDRDGQITARSLPRMVNVVTPGGAFHAMTPFRIVDSRANVGFNGSIGQGGVKDVLVAGTGGIPFYATGVVMNVTVTGGTAASYLTVFPGGTSPPTAANLLFAPGQTVPNMVTSKIGSDGRVAFFNQLGNVDVIADVLGYYDDGADATGSLFNGITPVRALDTRTGTGGFSGPLGPGETDQLSLTGLSAIPGTATAVVMNVTATGGTKASFMSVVPGRNPFTPGSPPTTANLLYSPGQTVPNLVVVGIGTGLFGGKISFYNQLGSVNVIADIVGYFDPTAGGGKFHPLAPTRMLDSRSNQGHTGKWGPAELATVNFGGVNPLPPTTKGIVANMTATGGSKASYAAYAPTPGPNPITTANLLFGPGQTIPNAAYIKTGTGGAVDIFNQQGTVNLIGDVGGYFANY